MKKIKARTDTECIQACVASILEVDIETIPEFSLRCRNHKTRKENGGHVVTLKEWLNSIGFEAMRFWIEDRFKGSYRKVKEDLISFFPNTIMMVGDGHHMVVMKGGKIIWDPSEDFEALFDYKNTESYTVFVPHDPSNYGKKNGNSDS